MSLDNGTPDGRRAAGRVSMLRKVANYLSLHGGWKFLRAPAYILRQPGFFQHDECKCKLCGGIVQTLVPHPGIPNRLALAVLPCYREVIIRFSDGSRHITPACSDCTSGNIGADKLLEMYYADLLAFDDEDEFGASPWEILDREPVGWSLQ